MSLIGLQGQPLSQHQWKDRLLLLFCAEPDNKLAKRQLESFQEESAALEDRDLLIYRICPDLVYGPDNHPEVTAEWFYKHYRVGKDEFNVILIGKDGGEKLRSEVFIEPEKIFDLIDTMPMRRAEMKNKGKGE